ncbi:Semaphorin-5A, partial [Goodea atripinnis]
VRNVTVDGGFGAWSVWSTCTHNDGGSAGACLCRTRACDNPAPQCGGQKCYGISVEVANCSRYIIPVLFFFMSFEYCTKLTDKFPICSHIIMD